MNIDIFATTGGYADWWDQMDSTAVPVLTGDTMMTLTNLDGTLTVINGTGLSFAAGNPVSVLSVEHYDAGGTILLGQVTGLGGTFAPTGGNMLFSTLPMVMDWGMAFDFGSAPISMTNTEIVFQNTDTGSGAGVTTTVIYGTGFTGDPALATVTGAARLDAGGNVITDFTGVSIPYEEFGAIAAVTDVDALKALILSGDDIYNSADPDNVSINIQDGDDTVNAGPGDDTITGGAGNDTIDGGDGIDTVVYSGNVDDYTATVVGGSVQVVDDNVADGDDGTDMVSNVEMVQFADAHVLFVGAGGFASIQAAVDAAVDGDIISVAGGTYTEQVVVDGINNLTITSLNGDPVTIVAPASGLVVTGFDAFKDSGAGRDIVGIVTVKNAAGFTLADITVDGDNQGTQAKAVGGADFVGIGVFDAEAQVDSVTVTGVQDTTFSGVQHGVGIFSSNADVANAANSVSVTNSTVDNFNKAGMVLRNAVVDLDNNTITGEGSTAVTAQNGIQISQGSTGSITNNTITGLDYSPGSWWSSGIMVYNTSGVDISGNTVTTAGPNTYGIYLDGVSASTIAGNDLSNAGVAIGDYRTGSIANAIDNTSGNANSFTNNNWGMDYGWNSSVVAAQSVDGSSDNDWITGGVGNDQLSGHGGDDTLQGGDGSDALDGGAGNDRLEGGADNDTISGGAGDDVMVYTAGRDSFDGGSNDDMGDTADFSQFGSAVWVDLGYAGHYEAYTRGGTDLYTGAWQALADVTNVENVVGTAHNDRLYGDGGDNILSYTGGFDQLDGRGNGDDGDTAYFNDFNSAVWVDLANASGKEAWTKDKADLGSGGTWRLAADLTDIENLVGTANNDKLWGDAGDNIFGYTGGFDLIDGRGDGLEGDTVDFSLFDSAIWVDLANASGKEAWTKDKADLGSGGIWRLAADLTDIENIEGTDFNDKLWGDAGNNGLGGQGGDDLLTGRGGVDVFFFEDAWGNDTITDFANDGFEKMDMTDTGLAFGDLTITDAGADTQVSDGTNTIVLTGIADHTTIDADDFIF